MKKIGFYGDSIILQQAGISHYNRMLLDWFNEQFDDDNIECIIPYASTKIKSATKIVKLNKWPLHQRYRGLISIPKYINKGNFDLVVEPAHFGPLRINKPTKKITVIHDLSPINYPHFHPWLSAKMHKWFIGNILMAADLIIANSETTKREIESFNSSLTGKVQVLYPKIVSRKENLDSNKRIIEAPYLLSVGTIEPRKNYSFLLDVYKEFTKQNPLYKLVILGANGWKNESFYHKLKSLNNPNIILPGYVTENDKRTWYQYASAYLSPSHYEGFGLPVIEAMAYDLPLFLSNISAYKEIAGKTAFILESNVDVWVKTLQRIIIDSKGKSSKKRIEILKRSRDVQSNNLKFRIEDLLSS